MTTRKTNLLGLCALLAFTLLGGASVVFATSTANLFFNINASDSASYSTSAPRVWNDLSTSSRNGQILGTSGLIYNGTTKALEFPGGTNSTNSLGYVDMGSGFANFGSGITIEFEGHFGAVNQAWERVFDFGNGDASNNIWVGVFGEAGRQNSLAIEIFHGSIGKNRCISAGNILDADTFAKWVITLDGTTCRMYKDGVEVDTEVGQVTMTNDGSSLGSAYPSLPININRTRNYIGRSNWGGDAAFDGALKYVRIYTSALTAAQVADNATTYTLTYATSDSDTGAAPAAITGNGLVTLASNTGSLVKAGHTFGGWATSSGQTTALGSPYNLTANITLHPVWTLNSYTVTYEEHGGSLVPNGSFTHGGSLSYPTPPTRAGFTFDGWFLAATGGTAQTASAIAAGNASITLHAQWSAVPATTTPSPVTPAAPTPTTTTIASTTPTTPATTVNPSSSGTRQGVRTVVIPGFTPGETLQLIVGPNGTPRTVTADANGNVTFTVRLSSTDKDSVLIQAIGKSRSVKKEVRFADSVTALPKTGSETSGLVFFGFIALAGGTTILMSRKRRGTLRRVP